jgi:transposase-like protein
MRECHSPSCWRKQETAWIAVRSSLRSVAEAVLKMLMEADVEGLIGAGRHERAGECLNYRNGFRDPTLDTRLGALQLPIPKLRQASEFPPFLD